MDQIIKSRSFQEGDREYQIKAEALASGGDLCVVVSGGDQPHIGAVALAAVAESPYHPQKWSATPSVISVPGHKEYHLALSAAEQLSKALERTVVVTVGIHIDGITPDLITRVEEEFLILISELAEFLRKTGS